MRPNLQPAPARVWASLPEAELASRAASGEGAAFEVLILQVLWTAVKPSPEFKDRFGPLIAILAGIAITVIAAFAIPGSDVGQAVLTGIMAGFSAMGIHDTADSAGLPV